MKYYKSLDGTKSTNGGNAVWTPGKWMPAIEGDLIPCQNGYHLSREQGILSWAGPNLWHCEAGEEIIEHDDKVVVREARITTKVEGWNDKNLRLFAADCAEHVLEIYVRNGGQDVMALMLVIHVAREFAHGRADREDLDAARVVAWEAAATAAAARSATATAATAAAWAAAGEAAATAAWAAAGEAAGEAAWEAAWEAEREWQLNRLKEYVTL